MYFRGHRHRHPGGALHQGRVPGGFPALRLVRAPRHPLAPDRAHGPAARQRHRGAPARARLARRGVHDRSRHARSSLPRARAGAGRRGRRRGRSPRRASPQARSMPSSSAPAPATCAPAFRATSSSGSACAPTSRPSTSSARAAPRRCRTCSSRASLIAAGAAEHVLSVCVEVSSAAMYLDNDPGVLISACLFGDGAGAAVLSRDAGQRAAAASNGRTAPR